MFDDDRGLTTVVSSGIRHLEDGSAFGEEFVCTLRSSEAVYAGLLVAAVCEVVVFLGKGLEFGDTLELPGRARDGSEISGVLASTHPCFAAEINYCLRPGATEVAAGDVDLQLVTLIPVTGDEMAYVAENGGAALVDLFVERRVDVLDLGRASSV
nr:hypothetical protein [Kibdelosporangium sp. MJ126-NF4]CTQ98843.1 hypothetical protein [Kibdelosporangium sp. MJ126-NF4]